MVRYERLAAATLIGFTLTVCKDNNPRLESTTTGASMVEAEGLKPLDPTTTKQLVSSFYPESKNSGLVAQQAARIPVRSKTPTEILNFTSREYQPDVIHSIYDYFEGLVDVPVQGSKVETTNYYPYNIAGQDRILALVPLQVKHRLTLILPEKAPRPLSWGIPQESSRFLAFTRISGNNALTFIETISAPSNRLFTSLEAVATVAVATEACHQIVYVASLDQKGNQLHNDREDILGQEIVCNSLGFFIAARYLDIPFGKYSEAIEQAAIRSPSIAGGNQYPFIVFQEESYNQIPTLGPILKQG